MEPTAGRQSDLMPDRVVKPFRYGTKLVLLLGFGGVLILMAAAGLNSIRVLRRIEAGNAQNTLSYLQRLHSLHSIRRDLYLSGSATRDFLSDPDDARARISLTEAESARGRIEAALSRLTASRLPEETRLVTELRAEAARYSGSLARMAPWGPKERHALGFGFFRAEIAPRRAAMVGIVDKIEEINESALHEGDRRSVEIFQTFRAHMLLVLILTLLVGIGLAGVTILQMLRLEKDAHLRYLEILRARTELRQLSARLVEAQEQERRSISRELHDEIGQSLSALLVDVGNLAGSLPAQDPETRHLLSTVRALAEQSLSAVRNMSLLLRPSMLDDFGLVPAIRWQAREVSRRTGMLIEVVAEDAADELPDEHKTCVYRVVQEALHNISRHAFARHVRIEVRQASGRILLKVQDDGRGFEVRTSRGLGLIGMEERVRRLGGGIQVQSQPEQGTSITIDLPLAEDPARLAPLPA